MDEFERAVQELRRQERRRVVRTTWEPLFTPWFRVTLGCGHSVSNLEVDFNLMAVAVGDEMDCPHCPQPATKH